MDAALAGFALAFATTIAHDMVFMVRRFVALEQAMVGRQTVLTVSPLNFLKVAVERVKEYSDLEREPPEFVEPRPPASWPTAGHIECEDLVIRYSVRCLWCRVSTGVAADQLFF